MANSFFYSDIFRRPRINAGLDNDIWRWKFRSFYCMAIRFFYTRAFCLQRQTFQTYKIVSRKFLRKKTYFGWTFRSCSSSNISCSSSDLYKLFLSFIWPLIASSPGTIVFVGIIHRVYDDISESSIFKYLFIAHCINFILVYNIRQVLRNFELNLISNRST